jgi:hypothetical protein
MLVQTLQGIQEIKRRDYVTDHEFYRAVVMLKFGVQLPAQPSFGEKIITA